MGVMRRMWRAFWVAMREPVRHYAPDRSLTIKVDVDSDEALLKLEQLTAKAQALRAESEHLH